MLQAICETACWKARGSLGGMFFLPDFAANGMVHYLHFTRWQRLHTCQCYLLCAGAAGDLGAERRWSAAKRGAQPAAGHKKFVHAEQVTPTTEHQRKEDSDEPSFPSQSGHTESQLRRAAPLAITPPASALVATCMQVPVVIRGPGGVGRQLGAEHSQRLESYFQSIPGVQLVACSTVANAKALLKSAIRSDNPIIFFEHVLLYNVKGASRGSLCRKAACQ